MPATVGVRKEGAHPAGGANRIVVVRQGREHDAAEARTKRHGRMGVPLLAAVLAAAGLAACGSSGPTSTTVTVSASAPAATSAAPTTAPATTASAPTASTKPAQSAARSPSPSSSGSGGGASGFRAPSGDNSIPNYGSEAPPTERERATAALAAFLQARAKGEWPRACTYLATPTRTQLERLLGAAAKGKAQAGGCGRTLAALSKGPAAAHADSLTLTGGVVALRIKGKSAFALFHGPKGSKYVMPMVSEGGAWKMNQLAPLPYPLGSAGAAP